VIARPLVLMPTSISPGLSNFEHNPQKRWKYFSETRQNSLFSEQQSRQYWSVSAPRCWVQRSQLSWRHVAAAHWRI